jgi:retron-type reverse transcriptase
MIPTRVATTMRWMRVVGITRTKVNHILDADIRSFFDEVSRDWLLRSLEHRIGNRASFA